jgi:hypothetical protein
VKSETKYLVRRGLFLAIVISLQFIGKAIPQISQYFVGSAVNAVLIMAAFTCGTWWGVAIGVMTPVTAWLTGQLAQPLAPFIPFIMVGNAIIVIFFGMLKSHGKWGMYSGWIAGAFFKYLFLYFSATKLIHVFSVNLPEKVVKVLAVAMGFTQFVTAIIGGIIALIIINTYLVKYEKTKSSAL